MEENPWLLDEQKNSPAFPGLKEDIETDIVIVGGGLAGILTAYMLSRVNPKIVLIEKSRLGSGATLYTTAFLTEIIDTRASDLKDLFGMRKTEMIINSHRDAIDLIEEIINKEGIECEFLRCSGYVYANSGREKNDIRKDAKIMEVLGREVKFYEKNIFNFRNQGFLEIKNQAKFHPIKFLRRLSDILSRGIRIYEGTEAITVSGRKNLIVQTQNAKIKCKSVVVATNHPFTSAPPKKGKYTTYVLEAEILKPLKEAIYWDYSRPYHYFRVDFKNGKQSLLLGGEDHQSELPLDPDTNFRSLELYLEKILPDADCKIVRRWRGSVLESNDGLALMGKTGENKFIASAFSGNGMTYSMVSAMLIKDLISGKKNALLEIYDPKRVLPASPNRRGKRSSD